MDFKGRMDGRENSNRWSLCVPEFRDLFILTTVCVSLPSFPNESLGSYCQYADFSRDKNALEMKFVFLLSFCRARVLD